MSIDDVVKYDVLELNTMSNPIPNYRDETPCVWCPRCKNRFMLGRGMDEEPRIAAVTRLHLEICEGDAAVTLMKICQKLGR